MLLLALPLSLAALRQAGCLTAGWAGGTPLWRQCGSPLVQSVASADLGRGLGAYLTGVVRLDEPVLTGAVTSLLAGLAPGTGAGQQRWFLVLWMLLAAALLAGLVVAVGTVRRHPAADPVALALSPVLALTVLLSADLLPVALAVVAVWAWSRDRARLAGVLAGLAVLGGAFSAVVLLAMVLVPGPGGRASVRRLVAAAGGTALAVAVVVLLVDPGTLTRPYAAWLADGAGPGSAGTCPRSPGIPSTRRRSPSSRCSAARWPPRWWCSWGGADRGPSSGRWRSSGSPSCCSPRRPCRRPPRSGWCPSSPSRASGGGTTCSGRARRPCTPSRTTATSSRRPTPRRACRPGGTRLALSLRLLAVGWVAHQAWVAASWGDAAPAGTLVKLPSERPVENHDGPVGSNAYPPVTERP